MCFVLYLVGTLSSFLCPIRVPCWCRK
uniref:Uncharacterized protein n=1 Tax=Arundo donax TaxID=35708 RepID=A0A0A9EUQ5_ARUDO